MSVIYFKYADAKDSSLIFKRIKDMLIKTNQNDRPIYGIICVLQARKEVEQNEFLNGAKLFEEGRKSIDRHAGCIFS